MRTYAAAPIPVFPSPRLSGVEVRQHGVPLASAVRVVCLRVAEEWRAVVEYGGVTVGVERLPVGVPLGEGALAVAREHAGPSARLSVVSTVGTKAPACP